MKRTLLISSLALLSASFAFAQRIPERGPIPIPPGPAPRPMPQPPVPAPAPMPEPTRAFQVRAATPLMADVCSTKEFVARTNVADAFMDQYNRPGPRHELLEIREKSRQLVFQRCLENTPAMRLTQPELRLFINGEAVTVQAGDGSVSARDACSVVSRKASESCVEPSPANVKFRAFGRVQVRTREDVMFWRPGTAVDFNFVSASQLGIVQQCVRQFLEYARGGLVSTIAVNGELYMAGNAGNAGNGRGPGNDAGGDIRETCNVIARDAVLWDFGATAPAVPGDDF